MNAPTSLIAELDTAIRSGSQDRRIETLRRVTDLFFAHSDGLSDAQVDLFDDVLGRMVDEIEGRALAELSDRMAPVGNAPLNVVRSLARHDEIAVAAPMLKLSPRLDERDLVEIAESKGQGHLLAIACRPELREPVTDVLVRRGNAPVLHGLAANHGARLSDGGFQIMVERAQSDAQLAEKVGIRSDIPSHRLQQLIAQATEEVRRRLINSAGPERADRINEILATISKEAAEPRDYGKAKKLVAMLQADGALNKTTFAEFAKLGRHEETIAALAALCGAPIELVARIFETGRYDAVLIACKAAGIGWPSVRLVLQKRPGHQIGSDHDLDKAAQEYDGLAEGTAQRVLRFWQVRQSAARHAEERPPALTGTQ